MTPEELAPVIHAAFRKAIHPEPGPDVALFPFAEIDPGVRAAWIASAGAAITALRDEDQA